MKLFINAGGKGERLKELTRDIPKPMVEIDGKPVLEHLVMWAKKQGVESIVMMNGYKAEVIENYFGDGSSFGIPIYHSTENEPLGSGGAIKYAQGHIRDTFIYISGDHLCDVNLEEMIEFHRANKAHLTALVHKSSHPEDSDILRLDQNSRVIKFISKKDLHLEGDILSNSGLCIIDPIILLLMDKNKFDFEGYVYPKTLSFGLNFFAYKTEEFISDMGTPERLEKCKRYLENKNDIKTIILYGSTSETLKEDNSLPMKLILGKPFLEHQIEFLKRNGLKDIILCGNDNDKEIQSYFGDGTRYEVNITYSQEETPKGTAGAIKLAEKYISGTFVVLNGDSLAETNLREVISKHNRREDAIGTVVVTNVENTKGYGIVYIDEKNRLKPGDKNISSKGMISTGIYVFNREILGKIPINIRASLEKEILPEIALEGKLYGEIQKGYFFTIDRPETYSQFKKFFLSKIQIYSEKSVREAMSRIDENRTDILLVLDSDDRFVGVLNENIIRKFIIKGGKPDQKVSYAMIKDPKVIGYKGQSEEEIQKLLNSGTRHLPILDEENKVHDLVFRKTETKKKVYPVIRGKAPLRISFAGGGTDMPYYFEKNGGTVISTTIDKYCHITLEKRADSKILINSDIEDEEIVLDRNDLRYNGKFDIIKAIIKVMNPSFGMNLHLHNDIEPGRGLGSSASFSSLMIKMIGELMGAYYDDEKVAETAYRIEVEELEILGGKQDQYAAVFGGFNWIEFLGGDRKIMHPLRIKEETVNELRSHITLCYTGKSHESKLQQSSQRKTFQENEEKVSKRLERLKKIAYEIKEELLSVNPSFERIGGLLHESWQYKREVSIRASNNDIERLYDVGMKHGAYGGKILGSGGGGYILFIHKPNKTNSLKKALEKDGGEILSFNFENRGIKTWHEKI